MFRDRSEAPGEAELLKAGTICKCINRPKIVLDQREKEGDREGGRKCGTSTNILVVESRVKSVAGEAKSEPDPDGNSVPGVGACDSAAQHARGRGRPRAGGPGQVVSCRLPAEELRAFDALCGQLGVKSRSDGVRSVVRMASGFLEFSREDSARLDEIRFELGKIGTNVNQIALAANRGRLALVRSQWGAVEELRRVLPGVAKVLAQVIAERRRHGVTLFRKFAEAQEASRHG